MTGQPSDGVDGGTLRSVQASGAMHGDGEVAASRVLPTFASETSAGLTAQRLEGALQALDQGLALFDSAERLIFCNGAYARLLSPGVRESLVGRTYAELLDNFLGNVQFASPEERSYFLASLSAQGRLKMDYTVQTQAGRNLRVSNQFPSGGGIVTFISEVPGAERQIAEASLARAAAASAANRTFLAWMSHELRTPLNAILLSAELLMRDARPGLSEQQQKGLARIRKGGEHVLRIVNDLRDLSCIEAGRISVSLGTVDVREMVEEVRAMLEPAAIEAGICMDIALPAAGSVPRVVADPTRLTQILMNFGSNAIKYNRARGRVSLAVSVPHPGCVRVSVLDTGHGIPAEQQHRLFQPFERAGREGGRIEGTGLGLAITRRLAELMRGTVGFRSAALGSEFWVELPASA